MDNLVSIMAVSLSGNAIAIGRASLQT